MKKNQIVTVDYLFHLLRYLSDEGYGDMIIKRQGSLIYTDEIDINCNGGQIVIRDFYSAYR